MSQVTHSDELVTKTDLASFYQGILPYLGGMPEVLANKFSKADLYSTDEKIIGRWIDGKPLYQKTIVDTTPNGTTIGTISTKYINIGASIDYGTVVDCNIHIQNSSEYLSAPYFDNDKKGVLKAVINDNTDASHPNTIVIIASRWFNMPCYATIQYTKTTDSSVEIGNDTDYSTTEKMVGTWIDGKPIYQKTVTGVCPSTSKAGTLVTGKLSNDALTNADTIVSLQGVLVYTPSGNSMPLPWTTSGGYIVQAVVDDTDRCVYISTNAISYNGMPARVTAQYTKTTD